MAGAMMAMMNNVVGVSYTPLAGSLQFNPASARYLSMSPGQALGAGAYTIEGWFYNNSSYATQKAFVATDQSGALSLFNTDAQSLTLDKYGGGGARTNYGGGSSPKAGGSGIVVLKYPDTRTITIGAGLTGSTAAPAGGFKVTTITQGTGNVSFA